MEEWMSLELKLISCKDLKAFNFFKKLSVYAVVSIFKDEGKKKEQQCLQRQKTQVDREGGGNPEWNQVMQFDLKTTSFQSSHLFLKFRLRCGGLVSGNRSIGEVRVPLKDLIHEFNGSLRFVSYQVRSSDGKPNGVLNFSYKVKGNELVCEEKVESNSKKRLYPCLDDEFGPPLPTPTLSPPPQFYYQTQLQHTYATPAPPLLSQLPAFAADHREYYHPYSSPFWYPTETVGYGCPY